MSFLFFIWFITSLALIVANLCYIRQLEKQIDILETKIDVVTLFKNK